MNHRYFLKFVWQFTIIYDLFLSFVFVSMLLFISLSWSCLHISNTHPVPLPTLWIYYGLPPKTFSNFTIFFSITCPYYCPTTSQQTIKHYTNIFYLSYLYNIRERVTNTEWYRVTKPKSQKKKKKNHRHKFNSQSPISVHHYQ